VNGTIPKGAPTAPEGVKDAVYNTQQSVEDDLTFSGYTFSGWSTTHVTVQDRTFTMPDKAVEFRGSWTAKPYTVNYHTDGGGYIAPKTGVHWPDSSLIPADAPTKANYTFAGWKLTMRGGAPYISPLLTATGETTYATLAGFNDENTSVTLTAQWALNRWTVTYAAGGDGVTGLPASDTVDAGSAYSVVAGTPSRTNHTFAGWTITKGGSGNYQAGGSFTMPNNDVTLTAQWTEDPISPTPPTPDTPTPTPTPTPPEPTLSEPELSEPTPPEPTPPEPTSPEPTPNPEAIANVEATENETTISAREGLVSFSAQDQARIESQTGNLFNDLANGNVPLGNFLAGGVWSLLSMLFAVLGLSISVVLILSAIVRRRRKDGIADEGTKRKDAVARTLTALTALVGVLVSIIWLLLDDLSLPVAWINHQTVFVGIAFAVQIIIFVVYVLRTKTRKSKEVQEVAL
jgi:uncharacterized repeat protein (TIGR02543 family)